MMSKSMFDDKKFIWINKTHNKKGKCNSLNIVFQDNRDMLELAEQLIRYANNNKYPNEPFLVHFYGLLKTSTAKNIDDDIDKSIDELVEKNKGL